MNKIDKLKKFLQENYPNEQAFNTRNWIGDNMGTVYDEDGIIVDYCYEYEYIEIFGLTDVEFENLIDDYGRLKKFNDEMMEENSIKNERSSIEEAIKIMEHWIEYEKNNKEKINRADELINIQETILSDYKRVLKENEILKKEKEQAWEEWNNLEQGSYETEQKLKQQIKESQRENEELKERIREHTLLISPYYVKENYIPIQKIKDKIEEENLPLVIVGGRRNKRTLEYGIKLGRRQALQELLGSEE